MTPQEVIGLRRKLSLTQTEFARLIGTRQHSVSRWEAGIHPPTGSNLDKLTWLQSEVDAGRINESEEGVIRARWGIDTV